MSKSALRLLRLAGALVLAMGAGSVAAGSGVAGPSGTLWASPSGSGTACTAHDPCPLDTAVANAPAGGTVRAQKGTYTVGGIVIDKELHLAGQGNPVLDATGSANGVGIQILNDGAGHDGSGSSIDHFTVENATYEGILVGTSPTEASGYPVSNVRIDHVNVVDNDQGFVGDSGPGAGECTAASFYDCGEGIHLVAVTNSVVSHSYVSGNAGGILLTDEFGPTSGNTIDHNTVVDNTHDCGITLASHVAQGVPFPSGPYGFGVFQNTISHNTVDRNGAIPPEGGGGILMAGGGPGTKVYENTIDHNEASSNGLAGVVIHLHVPGSDLHGNVITHNKLSNNNLIGDTDFAVADNDPTDILIAANGGSPNVATQIEHNKLDDATYGIWTFNAASAITQDHNKFGHGITFETGGN